jgi:hypothetical protein
MSAVKGTHCAVGRAELGKQVRRIELVALHRRATYVLVPAVVQYSQYPLLGSTHELVALHRLSATYA